VVLDKVGTLEGFYDVHASTDTKANVLSFVAVEDLYKICYVCCKAFLVHMPDWDLAFK
jgi:hypothetical protein